VLYDTSIWRQAARFPLSTSDLGGLSWSPYGASIALWDRPEAGLYLDVVSPQGERLADLPPSRDCMGLRSVAWSPSGQLLALGSYDQEVRLLNQVTWKELASFTHGVSVAGPAAAVAYAEIVESTAGMMEAGSGPAPLADTTNTGLSRGVSRHFPSSYGEPDCCDDPTDEGGARPRYVVAEMPLKLAAIKPPADKPNPKVGVDIVAWSRAGDHVATHSESTPGAVWVWDTSRLQLSAVLAQRRPVKCLKWHPLEERLAVACGTSSLSIWTPEGAACVHVPQPGFKAAEVRWNADGSRLLACSKDAFCVFYMA
jgi:WD40 repeat protein